MVQWYLMTCKYVQGLHLVLLYNLKVIRIYYAKEVILPYSVLSAAYLKKIDIPVKKFMYLTIKPIFTDFC